ncbi:MAG: ACT domain-containing protein, partial [Thermodesulfobacteriota bacterium]|nr:ACT domain-containing protein [Thermodesulfobacteriota bacterium]
MSEVVLLKISGEDKPGITFSLTEILAEHEVRILDVGQAVIHDLLSLGILIESPPGFKAPPLFKDLLARAEYLEVKLELIPISL